jgi:hypothetical protein
MATPTSTSVGASAPRATRPTAARATSPTATHLPALRQRPSGTSVYKIPTSNAARKVTCSDGSAQPPQPARITTPNGRGRRTLAPTTLAAVTTRYARVNETIRCRKRRSTSSDSSSPSASPLRTHHELSAASPRMIPTNPGSWLPASHPTIASSTTVTAMAGPRSPPRNTTTDSTMSTPAATSQPTPLVCRW